MTEEPRGTSRFRLPWTTSFQRVAVREPAPAPFEWRQTMKGRLVTCAALLVFWTVAIEARLIYLQVVAHEDMTVRANNQQLRTIPSPAKRGEILDRNGRVLAFSVDGDAITADPSQVEHPEQTARALCEALEECTADKFRDLLGRLKRRTQFAYLERQASPAAAKRVRALDLPGIAIHKESRRYYPKLELAAHVLGYVGVENKGLAGLESTYDSRVRGRDGRILLQIDSKQRTWAAREERAATAGDTLETTIDQYLQHIAERELRAGVDEFNAAGGTAIIMQPHTGEILALANWPTFNPNAFKDTQEIARKNRAIQDIYEPGSTFKLVTASAAFEEDVLAATDLIDCAPGYITFPGRRINDVHPYGILSFEDVIVKSSNVGAIKAGLKIGPERLSRYINRFGFGQTLSPDFRGESAGIVWNPARLDASGLASVSMGYQVSVTPLQMVSAVSSVANGGMLIEPRVVRAFIHDGRREPVEPKPLHRTVSPATAATMTQIMEAVVERGTATAAKVDGYTVAGKTGTAAKLVNGHYSNYDYNVSFVGFVPSRRPALAIIVMIDSPHGRVTSYGGTVAAPIFKRIAEASLRHLGVAPTINPPAPIMVARDDTPMRAPQISLERVAVRDGVVPDVRGLSAREAVRTLLRVGLTAHVDGSGFVVEQSPEAGTTVVPGDDAVLKLQRRLPVTSPGGSRP